MYRPLFIVLITLVLLSCSSQQKMFYYAADSSVLNDRTQTVLCLPVRSIQSRYVDNTAIKPEIEFSDSFYIEAANSLLLFELTHLYKVSGLDSDSAAMKPLPEIKDSWSNLVKSEGSKEEISELIRSTAEQFNADLIVIPYSCSIKHSAVRPGGWRDGKFSGSYDRPVSYTATAQFHLQIWSKDGNLLFEKIGKGSNGRPVFYPLFKNKVKTDAKNPEFAHKIFAPPLVKALNEAIRSSLKIQ
ncbi:MAG: hypothetical protein GX556_13580 [Fibrobacter sp.]|mgnify:CR=1 FL=1|nr:hypothetical protein [Fibrobacter sp.]